MNRALGPKEIGARNLERMPTRSPGIRNQESRSNFPLSFVLSNVAVLLKSGFGIYRPHCRGMFCLAPRRQSSTCVDLDSSEDEAPLQAGPSVKQERGLSMELERGLSMEQERGLSMEQEQLSAEPPVVDSVKQQELSLPAAEKQEPAATDAKTVGDDQLFQQVFGIDPCKSNMWDVSMAADQMDQAVAKTFRDSCSLQVDGGDKTDSPEKAQD